MQENKIIKLELPERLIEIIGKALAKRPYEEVAEIMNLIGIQVNEQIKEAEKNAGKTNS